MLDDLIIYQKTYDFMLWLHPVNAAFDTCTGTRLGSSCSFKFDKLGTWRYLNHLNPGDIGTIVIE